MSNQPFLTPGAGRVRASVERRSATVVVWLAHQPRLVPISVACVLFLVAIVTGGVLGGIVLLVIAAIMGWISYLSWPSVPGPLRLVRAIVLAGVVVLAVSWLA